MSRSLAILTSISMLALATPAHAAIQIFATPGAVQPSENVLLNKGTSGITVTGDTNQTHTSVTFQSLNGESLSEPANGQARIETADGSLSALKFFLTAGGGFTQFEFNLFKSLGDPQTVTIGYGGSNPGSQTFSLTGSGQNFFSGNATGNDFFSFVQFNTSSIGATDLRQVRIGGTSSAVPEPAIWCLMLLGVGMVGAIVRRRRRQVVQYSFA